MAAANFVSLAEEWRHRLETEKAPREGEERFRQLAEHLREAFWMVDLRDGNVVFVSPAFETIWACSLPCFRKDPNRSAPSGDSNGKVRLSSLT